ncbi:hypothetical protein NAPIS_ORF01153 [Vairimorpha apis BRL 01]|uniref:Uncharacterized protein n=1 Tax=Vairimorpha apis BRL 01 TaxID=1037528 RepID=T0L9U6_9MICR|nr:hypothetical protein NAPIS_ORF01153 [Vairimorpha apis BRL 01]
MQQELERKLAAKAEKDKLETIDLKQNDSFIDSTQFVSLEKNYMNDSNNFNSTISQNVKLELIKDESNTANIIQNDSSKIIQDGNSILVNDDERSKWLTELKKRGPRLRQPTLNISSYNLDITFDKSLCVEAKNAKLETIEPKQNDSSIDSTISQNVKLELIKNESNTANIIQNDSSKIIQDGNSILVNDDERSKWLTELKKRGPRLRQPTLNILNYRGNQTFIKEEPDERIITVEKKEQGTFNTENNKDIDVKSKKELNKIDINVKPSINSEQSNFNDNFQDNLNKASNSEINNQFIDIELTKKQISTKKVTFDEKKMKFMFMKILILK